ncbi:hypothetical protein DIPPA_07665 [Diplonema papillatum]|nr:hypothetical protein DIPPA_07665 [Diplonema papillatum]
MQAEILDLRSRCHGYHRAFEEAQKKLNALRILFTQKILPKMQNRDANNPDCLSTPVKSALSAPAGKKRT